MVLGRPNFPSQGEQDPVSGEKNQPPVAADWVPVQGHVVVEHPAPQVLPSPKEQKEEEAGPETKETPDGVQELKPEQEVKVEEELKPKQEPAPEAPVAEEAAKLEPEAESELVEEPDFQVESEVKVEVEGQPVYELEEEEIDPHFSVQPDPKVLADVQMELEPEEAPVLNEAPETFQAQGVEERHIDMEGKPQPVMELEPLDEEDTPAEEVSDTEMSEEEMAFREAFQEQKTDAAAEPLPEEEEELEDMADGEEDFREKENNVSDEQELDEPAPEMTGEQNPEDAADPALLDDELLDPEVQHTMPPSGNYFPEEEAGMEIHERDEGVPEESPEEQGMEDEGLPMMMRDNTYRQGK